MQPLRRRACERQSAHAQKGDDVRTRRAALLLVVLTWRSAANRSAAPFLTMLGAAARAGARLQGAGRLGPGFAAARSIGAKARRAARCAARDAAAAARAGADAAAPTAQGVPDQWGQPATGGTKFLGTPDNYAQLLKTRPISPDLFGVEGACRPHASRRATRLGRDGVALRANGGALLRRG